MQTMKGPAIFLEQFARDAPPFNSLAAIGRWAAGHGYRGVQIPTWDARLFDLERAASSDAYCDEIKGVLGDADVQITELATHVQSQLVAVHPAYDEVYDALAPSEVRGRPQARQAWAVEQMGLAGRASRRLGLGAVVGFSGGLAWPFVYPVPPRPAGLIDTAFAELGRRWRPVLNAFANAGIDMCFELHPGEDVFDGITFEMFLEQTGDHPRCCINYDPSHFLLQQLDYLGFIDVYHERIKAFHVKDAEFNPSPKQGVYSGYQPWLWRAGRFRSPGDGQIDFPGIFSRLAAYDYASWAVLEWECCLKTAEDGAREGAAFIADHIIRVSETSFEDGADEAANRRILGIG